MTTITSISKKGAELLRKYNKSHNYDLGDCYGSCSSDKARAEIECRNQMYQEGGSCFKIISYNSYSFSCEWINPDGSLRVETACTSYIVK